MYPCASTRRSLLLSAAVFLISACATIYPVRVGIAVFLTPDLPRDDLWQQADDQLSRLLLEQPDLERQLMQVPLERLNAADQFFRALVLEQRGRYAEARVVHDRGLAGLYSAEYRACFRSQIEYVVEQQHFTPRAS